MVWLETPTNPLLRIADIEAICTGVHNYNENIVVAVDNTFLTPYNQVSKVTLDLLSIHQKHKT